MAATYVYRAAYSAIVIHSCGHAVASNLQTTSTLGRLSQLHHGQVSKRPGYSLESRYTRCVEQVACPVLPCSEYGAGLLFVATQMAHYVGVRLVNIVTPVEERQIAG